MREHHQSLSVSVSLGLINVKIMVYRVLWFLDSKFLGRDQK